LAQNTRLLITIIIMIHYIKYKYNFDIQIPMEQESTFVETLGNYPLIRLYDFLIESRDLDYPVTEIARNANIHFQTFQKIWPALVKNNVVIATRKLHGRMLYKLNKNHPIAKKLIEFDKFVSDAIINQCIKSKS
jgi:hypothetical protein